MFNKRWKKILLWTLSVIVVLGVGGLFAANYAVDKLMNSMVDSFDLESESDVSGSQDQGTAPKDTVVDGNVDPVKSATPSTDDEGSSNQGSKDNGKTDGGKEASATSEPTDTSLTSNKELNSDGYSVEVSPDKAQKIKENVTVKEKADVVSIVLGELSVSDIKRLQELAKGGLSSEEKYEARSIILGKVSEEQYNELSQIAKKYGVSQGKTRDQIIAEEQLKAKEKGSE